MAGLLPLLILLTTAGVLGAFGYRMWHKGNRRRRCSSRKTNGADPKRDDRGKGRIADEPGDKRAENIRTEEGQQDAEPEAAARAAARSGGVMETAASRGGTHGSIHPRRQESSKRRAAAAPHDRNQQKQIPAQEANASQAAERNASEDQSAARNPQPSSKDTAPGAEGAGEGGSNAQQEDAQQTEPEEGHEGAVAAEPPASETDCDSPADDIAVERRGDGSSPADAAGDHPASKTGRDQIQGAGDATGSPDTAAAAPKPIGEAASGGARTRGPADRADNGNHQKTGAAIYGHRPKGKAHSEPVAGTHRERAAVQPSQRPPRPAIYQDARGRRRAQATEHTTPLEGTARPPAEAKLRLLIRPIQRRASLSVVLARPEGYPESVTVHANGQRVIEAYNEQRYDDLELTWTTKLLDSELRVEGSEGFHWVRSARRVHIFTEDPAESGLMSVGTARAGATHTVVCRSADAEAVQDAATATGSPRPETDARLVDVPDGWALLTGYAPVHAATSPLPAGLQPLDPGTQFKIEFEDGLAIQAKIFAEGDPPRITISPEPSGASVTIGGQPATLAAGGGWVAPGWDAPGHHMVDVTPGPSAKYEIVADPWSSQSWKFWNGHPGRFGDHIEDAWGKAEICGASIQGPEGQAVLAARTAPILVALGARGGAAQLHRRDGMEVSMGLVAEPPEFLLSARGQRRTQGRVIWLGLAPSTAKPKDDDPAWGEAVRWAAARRLRLEGGGPCAEEAWRKAKRHARRHRKARR